MGKFEEYLDKAKDLAEDAGDVAKHLAGDVVNRARELTEEGSKARELAKSAKEQSATLALGAREKIQGVLQDARTGKEIGLGIAELKNLPEFEGSILYTMELEAMINDLNGLVLYINDGRLDDASVAQEISKVMAKVQPAPAPESEEAEQQMTDEQKAIERAKSIAFSACSRALEALNN